MAAMSSETLHATTVAIGDRAVMLCGVSGSGKSDLSLRLIDRGAKLVSDDYTLVKRVGKRLLATSPATIAGKMEIRGVGVVDMAWVSDVPVALVVDLFDVVDRMPMEPMVRAMAGVKIPVMKVAPREASAPIKVEFALRTFGLGDTGSGA